MAQVTLRQVGKQYARLVDKFRELTVGVHEETGRCCLDVRDGSPACCYQIADGAELTFSLAEAGLLVESGQFWAVDFELSPDSGRLDGYEMVLNRTVWSPERILKETWDGTLANTLECASHPLRPVIGPGKHGRPAVLAVAAVNGCNTELMMEFWRGRRPQLLGMWSDAVAMLGLKNYYAAWGVKDEWRLV